MTSSWDTQQEGVGAPEDGAAAAEEDDERSGRSSIVQKHFHLRIMMLLLVLLGARNGEKRTIGLDRMISGWLFDVPNDLLRLFCSA